MHGAIGWGGRVPTVYPSLLCLCCGLSVPQLEPLGLLGQVGGLQFPQFDGVGMVPVVTGPIPALGLSLVWSGLVLGLDLGLVHLKLWHYLL